MRYPFLDKFLVQLAAHSFRQPIVIMSAKLAAQSVVTFPTSLISTASLVPFLYQTRTLSDGNWIRTGGYRYRGVTQRRPFGLVPRLNHAIDDGTVPQSTPSLSGPSIKWSPLRPTADVETLPDQEIDPNAKIEAYKEWDGQIRTIITGDTSATRNRAMSKHEESAQQRYNWKDEENFSGFAEAKSIDFDEEMNEDYLMNTDEIADLTRSHPLGESTITDSERYAFQKIFRDIFGRKHGSGIGIEGGFSSASLSNENGKGNSNQQKAPRNASYTSNISRHEMEAMVGRYPAPLQAAAARAIGLTEVEAEGEQDTLEDESVLDMEKVEKLRQPERDRVELLMKDAKTDFELWKVMEKEVFSLIPRLGLQDVVESVEPSKKSKRRSKNSTDKLGTQRDIRGDSAQLEPFSVNEDGISPLSLYGPLYPSYVLFGLRLLDRSFSKPSPLTLTLLPKIKSLGLISHVLGASSQLYNELLQIHRYRYDDYRGILQLLTEMEHSGIEFDQETLDIVQDIQRGQASARKGDKGPAIQTLWSLPEFVPNKFKAWSDKIRGDIKNRALAQRAAVRY